MKKLKIGMVGIGFIADFHFKGFKGLKNAEITGITRDFYGDEKNREKAWQALIKKSEDFGIKPYKDFDDMVDDPEIQALIITSINPLHFPQILKAIDKGKHMLVEKPVVTDFKHLDEIERLSLKSGIKIFPAHNFAYRKAVQEAKKIMDSKALGRIVHASFIVSHQISDYHAKGWRADRNLSAGGALMDSGHHLVYQSLYLMGKPVKLQAFTSKIYHKGMECEDTASVNLLYKDGALGTIMQSWASDKDHGINGIRIIGDKASIQITDALYFNSEIKNRDVDYARSFRNQAEAFVDYIKNDREPVSTLKDIRNTLKIIFGAYESAEKDRVIALK